MDYYTALLFATALYGICILWVLGISSLAYLFVSLTEILPIAINAIQILTGVYLFSICYYTFGYTTKYILTLIVPTLR